MAFWNKKTDIEKLNKDLVNKTKTLVEENSKMSSFLNSVMTYNQELFTGESTYNELGPPKEIVIAYETLRTRSWEFLLKNHLASLIVTKRVNWQIGSGLLFNAKPLEKPFTDFYGKEEGRKKQREFIREIEYQYRNFINSVEFDYKRNKNGHELARESDYNACGDGDTFILMRVKDGFPNIQLISGQCVENPIFSDIDIKKGHSICEGVETDTKGKVVAYHVLVDTDISNGVYTPNPIEKKIGTKRIPAYFKGTDIKQAWLYKASDLQKLGETRAMPLLSHVFESLKHVNDYLIANSRNAQLLAQMVFFLEKDENSDGARVFNDVDLNVAGMSDVPTNDDVAASAATALASQKIDRKLNGNGISLDLPKGVTAKIMNPSAQKDQAEYLSSALRTISATFGIPYETLISTYNSNYTASMGSRSDFQHILDVMTKLIAGNQFYKPHYKMFLYLQVLKGAIKCPPLEKAYKDNDIITIAALNNSSFEGTKLKPIDPLKFIKSIKEQIPAEYRELIPLNSLEKLVDLASGGDFENITTQYANEIDILPDELKPKPEPEENANISVQ